MIQAVIPTIPGREKLLAEAVASFESHGIESVIIRDSPSCGEGWAIGLRKCTGDYVLLASDDVEAGDFSELELACHRANAGLIVSPVIRNVDGSLQGAGGLGLRFVDGAVARNTIFPFAHRDTFELVSPWPPSNHYCDCWISERASSLGRGPIVTHGLDIVHKIISPDKPTEVSGYDLWRSARLAELDDAKGASRRSTETALRIHAGAGFFVVGLRGRVGTERRLVSTSVRGYLALLPSRTLSAVKRGAERLQQKVNRYLSSRKI